MTEVDVQAIRARADDMGSVSLAEVQALCDEAEQLRDEVDELIVDRDTGFRDRMAQHDREQMRRERDQARAVIAEVDDAITAIGNGATDGATLNRIQATVSRFLAAASVADRPTPTPGDPTP